MMACIQSSMGVYAQAKANFINMVWPSIHNSSIVASGKHLESGNYVALIISSDNDLRRKLEHFCGEHSLQVQCADDLHAVAEHSFDLLLLAETAIADVQPDALLALQDHDPFALILLVSGRYDLALSQQLPHFSSYVRLPCDEHEFAWACAQACRQLELERSVEKSDALLQAMVNGSPDPVYILDKEGHFMFVNDRLETMLGHPRGSLIGQHYSVMIHADDKELARYIFSNRKIVSGLYQNIEIRLQPAISEAWLGANAITVEMTSSGIFTSSGQDRFIGVYGLTRHIAETKAVEDSIHFQAYHDFLTGLPNRVLFKDRLDVAISQAKRQNKMLAVMFIDLNKFKDVNDNLGHPVGDEVLQLVAERVKAVLRRGDTLARFGGDEFIVLLPEANSAHSAEVIAQKIIKQFYEPFHIRDNQVTIGASIGIALYPDSGSDVEEMIAHADLAMYHAKNLDKVEYQVFSRQITHSAEDRQQLKEDLQQSLDEDQFTVCYQPQIDLVTGAIKTVECLVRWHHPERGLVPRETFLAVAEQSGLIAQVNEKMHKCAFQDMLDWQDERLPPVSLLLTMSASQVRGDTFPGAFLRALEQSRLENNQVEVGIMEDVITQDIESLAGKFARIGRAGTGITIDGFGAAWFSLFHLQRFPISTLKVDRAFVRELHGYEKESVIKGIVAMAHALHIQVVVDGVETKHQLKYLQDVGCNSAQGPFFGPPLSAEAMVKLLQEQPWSSSRQLKLS